MERPRILFVHAHPDDETLVTGATIAHYAAMGAEVCVVTCTLGEEGEVIGERWARLVADDADQLGGYRIGELTAALGELGVDGPVFLGGAGRWRDSGMAGTPARGRGERFADADLAEPVAALTEIIRTVRPHVLVSYDENGGYGHPDHIRTHDVAVGAVSEAADSWRVPKFYWAVTSHSALADGLADLADVELPAAWIRLPVDDFPFRFDDGEIDAVIDAPASRDAKIAAMGAHATQVTVSPDGRAFVLSNDIVQPVLHEEHFVLAAGEAGERDGRGWETDLLSGLNLG
ncbi:N-acetyl-1-D-myo-inositol-2-amino-2-deoxy-alpha-D-glucopyranoside deacetylase [Mycolicibacterium sediminis]|uniref:1D-myo-inositol 2-acetamido-2-deoxy-alpha-D-glucopyranoside deacetylase n=1 Tax=Mycolicibacterium sediminis TaxID=1286180 RepID=A0A7I7QYH2_9MYCO|nr:N-acetyl-1-D-myo-inositol-2-amino-2-deoxy-alpha-D-glucopyranoside deacetylase [Mycolicibacterium sediminis]BBY31325.1 1D-myo-inositol 2-acetamido-2-deoxy-alpha-D-glucopyranoside deacetylase [Mycolicibacterium sediminis]